MKLLPPVVAALLVLAGCQDGPESSSSPDPDRIRSGLAAIYAGDHADDRAVADSECFATGFTERTTPDQLRRAGVLDASYAVVAQLPALPQDVAEAWVDAQFACSDFVAESARAQTRISKGKVDEVVYARCLRRALTDEQLRAAVADTLTGDWEGADLERFSVAQGRCARAAR